MKRIITAILLIVSFQLNAQVLNNQCESQTPCNALPICGTATVSIAPSYSTTAPVSYTHLDVYKRQAHRLFVSIPPMRSALCGLSTTILAAIQAAITM